MDLPLWLEVGAHALTAVLGAWLGLTVLTRSGVPGSRVFALLSLTLATWSSAVIVGRLSESVAATHPARAIEELAAVLALGGTAHFSLVIATDGHPSRRRRTVIVGLYGLLVGVAIPTMLDPNLPVSIAPPHYSAGPLSGELLGWLSIGLRLVTLGLAVGWLIEALRAPGVARFRVRQLAAALAFVGMGGFGAALRFIPGIDQAEAWIGVSFVSLAVVLATYVVFSAGIFFGTAVASRAFRTSLVGGLSLFALVAVLVVLDSASRDYLGLQVPFFTALGLVVSIALYEPIAAGVRRFAVGSARSLAGDRLLRALGQSSLTAQPAASGVQPALARLGRALDVTGLSVVGTDGTVLVSEGVPVGTAVARPVPLAAGGEILGELRVGPTASGQPLEPRDEELLELSAFYVAIALLTSQREDSQASALTRLAEDRAAVESQASALHAALVGHREEVTPLRVHALGPLRVERGEARLERWGGEKAGSRQAEAMFAFLFDRGERGVPKDEVVELLWPDIDLDRADLAFHRTLGGLRATLEPGKSAAAGTAIRYVNDRYRLSATIVAWSDVDEFLALLRRAREAADPHEQIGLLEQARHLYRGDYLDDCPFYGDSVHVEPRRVQLRDRLVDLLVDLGERYEALGDRLSAAGSYRDALERSLEESAPARAGMARLGL